MLFDEERKPPGKNKRPRLWLMEIRYLRGIGVNWGWVKRGLYRTQAEAQAVVSKMERNWRNDMEFRITFLGDRS